MSMTWKELSTLPVGTKLVFARGELSLRPYVPIPVGSEWLIVMQGLNELTAELWLRPYSHDLLDALDPVDEECIKIYMPGGPDGWAGEAMFDLPASGRALDLDALQAWALEYDGSNMPSRHDEPQAQAEGAELTPPAFYTVAIFLVDRAYGGPEEGGWWYDCGVRQDEDLSKRNPRDLNNATGNYGIPRIFDNEESACAWCENVNTLMDITLNVGRREIGSVLSTGRYVAGVYNNYPPTHWPAVRPHYE